MKNFSLEQLNAFIVRAKAATYVGGGAKSLSYRPGSHDLQYHEDAFSYLDGYFGGTDFLGQEVVYFEGKPVWSMNYYGRVLEPSLISAAETGQIIQESLSKMYQEGRFLGGFEHSRGDSTYVDTSQGDVAFFTGKEWITRDPRVLASRTLSSATETARSVCPTLVRARRPVVQGLATPAPEAPPPSCTAMADMEESWPSGTVNSTPFFPALVLEGSMGFGNSDC